MQSPVVKTCDELIATVVCRDHISGIHILKKLSLLTNFSMCVNFTCYIQDVMASKGSAVARRRFPNFKCVFNEMFRTECLFLSSGFHSDQLVEQITCQTVIFWNSPNNLLSIILKHFSLLNSRRESVCAKLYYVSRQYSAERHMHTNMAGAPTHCFCVSNDQICTERRNRRWLFYVLNWYMFEFAFSLTSRTARGDWNTRPKIWILDMFAASYYP